MSLEVERSRWSPTSGRALCDSVAIHSIQPARRSGSTTLARLLAISLIFAAITAFAQKPTQEQLIAALKKFKDIGVKHMALQFMVGRWPERKEKIERVAKEVLPHVR